MRSPPLLNYTFVVKRAFPLGRDISKIYLKTVIFFQIHNIWFNFSLQLIFIINSGICDYITTVPSHSYAHLSVTMVHVTTYISFMIIAKKTVPIRHSSKKCTKTVFFQIVKICELKRNKINVMWYNKTISEGF